MTDAISHSVKSITDMLVKIAQNPLVDMTTRARARHILFMTDMQAWMRALQA